MYRSPCPPSREWGEGVPAPLSATPSRRLRFPVDVAAASHCSGAPAPHPRPQGTPSWSAASFSSTSQWLAIPLTDCLPEHPPPALSSRSQPTLPPVRQIAESVLLADYPHSNIQGPQTPLEPKPFPTRSSP